MTRKTLFTCLVLPIAEDGTFLISICIVYLSFFRSFRPSFDSNNCFRKLDISPFSMNCLYFSTASPVSVCSKIMMDPSDVLSTEQCVFWARVSSALGMTSIRHVRFSLFSSTELIFISTFVPSAKSFYIKWLKSSRKHVFYKDVACKGILNQSH